MKIYIFADMEGISGVSGSEHVSRRDGNRYEEGCEYFLMDANACIEGCVKAGADEVFFVDGHGGGGSISWKKLHPAAELIKGGHVDKRFVDIEGCDALILLGYHAMAGTEAAILEHTYSSSTIQNMWLNGKLAGEFAFDSAIAAEYGVPTIMVSGDDKVCAEAKSFIPDIVTCQVKKSYSTQGARLLPMEKAHKLIEEKTMEAIGKKDSIKPPRIDYPATVRKELVERCNPRVAGSKRIDARTVEFTSKDSLEKAFYLSTTY